MNRSDGRAVVVTLHRPTTPRMPAPRAPALKAGRLVYDGPSAGLERARLVEIYGPEFEDVFWEGAPQ